MLTRNTLKLPLSSKAIFETVTSDNWQAEVKQLRQQVNALRKEHYEFMRAMKDYIDGLNGKGVLAITQATIQSSTIGAPTASGTPTAAAGTFTDLIVNTSSVFPTATYTPTVTAQTGAFTTVSATGRYTKIGNTYFFFVDITITTNGTAAGSINFTLPATATANGVFHGREVNLTGRAVFGDIDIAVDGTKGLHLVFTSDLAYPGADGRRIRLAGFFI